MRNNTVITLLALAIALRAEDTAPPTVEQLQAQLAAKDQEIAQLQGRLEQTLKLLDGNCLTFVPQ